MRVPLLVLLSRTLHDHLHLPSGPLGNGTLAPEAFAAPGVGNATALPPAAFLQPARSAEDAKATARHAGHVGLCGVVGCLCGLAVGGASWFALQWWRQDIGSAPSPILTRDVSAQFSEEGSPRNLDEVEKRRSRLNRELDRLKEKEQLFQGDDPRGAVPTLKDYDSLLRTVVQEAVHRFLPTLSRGQAIRNIAETRASNFAMKARAFVLNELNGAAGDLCEALDAPEAMLLLDLNSATAAHLPPVAVLLAGLLTPFLLQVMLYMHITQLALVLAPFAALVTWAMVMDFHSPCQAIPGIHVWVWVQLVLVYLLIWARALMVLQIRQGQFHLNAKAAEARQAHLERRAAAGGEGGAVQGLLDLRELFVSQASLVQQVLLLEDRVRSGTARHVVGFATLLWLLVMVWTFVLVLLYALVPGTIEFYSPYYSSPQHYCGAWATVLTARISCLVAVVVFGTNFATVCHWLSDVVVHSDAFSNFIMRYAQQFDESLLGLPIAQLLTKAFLLRDSSDMTFTKLAVAMHEKAHIANEMKATEEKLEALKRKMAEKEASVEALKKDTDKINEAGSQAGAAMGSPCSGSARPSGDRLDLAEAMNVETWLQTWRQRGKEAIDVAHSQAVQIEQVTTEDFDRVVQRIMDGTEQLRQSLDNVRDASSDPNVPWSQVIGAIGDEFTRQRNAAGDAARMAPGAHVEAFISQSGPVLQSVIAQVVETSQRVGQQVQEGLQQYGPEVVERGHEVIERIREYSPEVVERGQQVMEQIRTEGLLQLPLPLARHARLRMRTAAVAGLRLDQMPEEEVPEEYFSPVHASDAAADPFQGAAAGTGEAPSAQLAGGSSSGSGGGGSAAAPAGAAAAAGSAVSATAGGDTGAAAAATTEAPAQAQPPATAAPAPAGEGA